MINIKVYGMLNFSRYLRSSIVYSSCGYRNELCVQQARDLFQQYMDNPDVNP